MELNDPSGLLARAGDLLENKLIPSAVAAGYLPTGTRMVDLVQGPISSGDTVRSMLETLAQVLSVAVLSANHDHDDVESAKLTALAASTAQFAHGFVSHACGTGPGEPLAEARSAIAKRAANARHAPTRNARELVGSWWREHGAGMTREAAADAIVAARIVSESRRTVRGWLVGL